MKRAVLFIIIAAIALTIAVFGGYNREKKERELMEKLAALKDVAVPARFKILEREKGAIKAEFQFYSLIMNMDEYETNKDDMEYFFSNKTPVQSRTLDLEGQELFIDFITYREKEGAFAHPVYWVFPYRVFTSSTAPDNGILIVDYYDEGGFPATYNSFDLSGDKRENLRNYYSLIKSYGALDDTLKKRTEGQALHDMDRVARFRVGRWYDVVVHIKSGSIEFLGE